MTRQSYDTDLTDGQWQILEALIPAAKSGGRPRSTDMREVLNVIFGVAKSRDEYHVSHRVEAMYSRAFEA